MLFPAPSPLRLSIWTLLTGGFMRPYRTGQNGEAFSQYWLIHDERSPLIWIDFTSLITAVKLYGIPPLSNANGS
ncbi:hypothetical protein EYX47_12550 [Escherichia coli]|nr:hypothetical protein [Escherichia coli]